MCLFWDVSSQSVSTISIDFESYPKPQFFFDQSKVWKAAWLKWQMSWTYMEAPFFGQYVLQQIEPQRWWCQVALLEKVLVYETCEIL